MFHALWTNSIWDKVRVIQVVFIYEGVKTNKMTDKTKAEEQQEEQSMHVIPTGSKGTVHPKIQTYFSSYL